jgi:hypothetical protein
METNVLHEFPNVLIISPKGAHELQSDIYVVNRGAMQYPLDAITNIKIAVAGTTISLYRSLDVQDGEFILTKKIK